MSFKRRRGLAIVVLAALSILPFLRAVSAFFVADDLFLIPPLAGVDASVVGFAWNAVTRLEHVPTTFYRPLPFITLWLEVRTFGMRPEVMHLTNLALHAGATMALFLLARRLLDGPRRDRAALLAAAAFALFPRRVEPVVWISARPDMLASFFVILAALLLVEALQPSRRTRGAAGLLGASTLATWGAFLSKESVFLIPLAAIAVLVFRQGPDRAAAATASDDAEAWRARERQARIARWVWTSPLLLSMAAYPILRTTALDGRIGGYAGDAYRLDWKLLTYPAKYVAYSIMPPLDLLPALAHSPWAARAGGLCMLVILLAVAALIVRRRACPCARLGAAWLVAACLPVLAFTPSLSTTFNDRFLYLPGIGMALLVASALARVSLARRTVWASALAVVALYGVLTVVVVERWRLAGALTAQFGRQLADQLARVPGDEPIFVASVPDSLAGAYVLRTGLQELAALSGGPRPQRLFVLTNEFMEGPPQAAHSTVVARRIGANGLVIESLAGYPAVRLASPTDQARIVQAAPPADSLERRQQVEFALPVATHVWSIGANGVEEVASDVSGTPAGATAAAPRSNE